MIRVLLFTKKLKIFLKGNSMLKPSVTHSSAILTPSECKLTRLLGKSEPASTSAP
jgi:hypothetical protein